MRARAGGRPADERRSPLRHTGLVRRASSASSPRTASCRAPSSSTTSGIAHTGRASRTQSKWPDLRGWIAARHDAGQRVLLWYKAWDAEGVPAEACITNHAGSVLGLDPSNPAGEAAIRAAVARMLSPDGLDADGLKIDFTARTPSGVATRSHGGEWGVDLLRRLLDTMADEARGIKPDALLVGQTPNSIVAPAVDMIRLNDALRLDDPPGRVDLVGQMRIAPRSQRQPVREHLIDTDDWCVPDLASWRAYTASRPTSASRPSTTRREST